jgi:hypothetical protein
MAVPTEDWLDRALPTYEACHAACRLAQDTGTRALKVATRAMRPGLQSCRRGSSRRGFSSEIEGANQASVDSRRSTA